MIDAHGFVSVVKFLVAIVVAYVAWRKMLVPAINQAFRQRLFDARRQLFNLAADGLIPFEHRAYGHARGMINGLLRNGEVFSFTRLALTMKKDEDSDVKEYFDRIFEGADPEARKKIEELTTLAFIAAIKRAVATSIPALLLIGFALVFFRIRRMFRRTAPAGRGAIVEMVAKETVLFEAESLDAIAA